jgi:acetone carboxylase gamma subunit
MRYRLGENVELVVDASGGQSVQCAQCGAGFGDSATQWQQKASTWDVPTGWAGPLMSDLTGNHLLEQLVCPCCGALFETRLKNGAR